MFVIDHANVARIRAATASTSVMSREISRSLSEYSCAGRARIIGDPSIPFNCIPLKLVFCRVVNDTVRDLKARPVVLMTARLPMIVK